MAGSAFPGQRTYLGTHQSQIAKPVGSEAALRARMLCFSVPGSSGPPPAWLWPPPLTMHTLQPLPLSCGLQSFQPCPLQYLRTNLGRSQLQDGVTCITLHSPLCPGALGSLGGSHLGQEPTDERAQPHFLLQLQSEGLDTLMLPSSLPIALHSSAPPTGVCVVAPCGFTCIFHSLFTFELSSAVPFDRNS